MHFSVTVRSFHAFNASRCFFRDALRDVNIIYCDWQRNWAASSQVALCNQSSTPKQTSHNHCLSSLSVTWANSLWLKQPTQFLQGRLYLAFPASVQKGKVLKKQPCCAQQLDDVEHAYQLEAPELGTLLQNFQSEWCSLQRGSTVLPTMYDVCGGNAFL